MKSAILEQFTAWGLGEKDLLVFRTVLKLGVARAAEIARAASLQRQTAYTILSALVSAGLVDQRDKRGVKHFSSEPKRILAVMGKQRDALDEADRSVQKELPEYETLRFRAAPIPHIQYYEGTAGLHRLFDDMLAAHKKGEKEFRGWGVNMMGSALGDFLQRFIQKRAVLGVKTQLFVGQGPDDLDIEKTALGRTAKRLSYPAQNAALYMVGDAAYLFSYADQVGLVIENRAIAKLLKSIFDDQWLRVR